MTQEKQFSRFVQGLGVAFLSLLAFLFLATGALAAVATEEPAPAPSDDEVAAAIEQELVDIVDLHEPAYATTVEQKSFPTGGGGAPTRLIRKAPSAYWDGISDLAGQNRPGPREVSNGVLSQAFPVFSGKRASDMTWQWGQFVDHDIDLTDPHEPKERADIPVPLGDPFFDPTGAGGKFIPFERSIYDPMTGTDPSNPRQQLNVISAFIDGTNIYGQDPARTDELRLPDAYGNLTAYLKTSPGNFLPWNDNGFPNAMPPGSDPKDFFLAGDVRSNEQLALTAMHTLWVREHNRTVDYVRTRHHTLTEQEIFDTAREIVVGELQVITYEEFLPLILGTGAFPTYVGFDPWVDPGIANVFSTALYRLGHTMLSDTILRLNPNGTPSSYGNLPLREAFFVPQKLINEGGLEPIMKGLSSQIMQKIDSQVVDDVRNFLFGDPMKGTGLDLASLNIQRGRDHGLPDYNTFRIAYGLIPASDFDDITSDTTVRDRLADTYTSVDDVDVWVGALAEDPMGGGILVGELLYYGLVDQFLRLRDGDPSWWQLVLSPPSHNLVKKQTLAKVILRNTTLLPSQLQANVFVVP